MATAALDGLAMPDPLSSSPAGRTSTVLWVLRAVAMRPAGRRTLAVIASTLAVTGMGLLAYPTATDVYARAIVQPQLAAEYREAVITPPPAAGSVAAGKPLTRLVVPRLGLRTVVVEGTSPAALRAGAGHYPDTPPPGSAGNVGIAGHRTTFGQPFRRLDELRPGDAVHLQTPSASYTYRVLPAPAGAAHCGRGACWVTAPDDWSVVDPLDGAMLTLTTCHPEGSAAERLIVRAELARSGQPVIPRR